MNLRSMHDQKCGYTDLRPKELGAVVLLDEAQVVRAVSREDGVYVGRLLQPVAALR